MPQVAVFSSSDETSDTLDSTSPEVYPSVQAFPDPPLVLLLVLVLV